MIMCSYYYVIKKSDLNSIFLSSYTW